MDNLQQAIQEVMVLVVLELVDQLNVQQDDINI
jgi:hypothetical protein